MSYLIRIVVPRDTAIQIPLISALILDSSVLLNCKIFCTQKKKNPLLQKNIRHSTERLNNKIKLHFNLFSTGNIILKH